MTDALFHKDAYLTSCDATILAIEPPADGADAAVLLDRTVFYPLGGGQLGDTGALALPGARQLQVRDARKSEAGDSVRHLVDDLEGLEPGMAVQATLDWPRRHRIMRYHTALHLLCSLIDAPVTSGSIQLERARLDFDLPESPDKAALGDALDELVERNVPISTRWISDAELDAQPELVRTLSVQPPRNASGTIRLVEIDGIDLQPCGGTHVARTGEVGRLRVQKIEKKGRQNRRIIIVLDD